MVEAKSKEKGSSKEGSKAKPKDVKFKCNYSKEIKRFIGKDVIKNTASQLANQFGFTAPQIVVDSYDEIFKTVKERELNLNYTKKRKEATSKKELKKIISAAEKEAHKSASKVIDNAHSALNNFDLQSFKIIAEQASMCPQVIDSFLKEAPKIIEVAGSDIYNPGVEDNKFAIVGKDGMTKIYLRSAYKALDNFVKIYKVFERADEEIRKTAEKLEDKKIHEKPKYHTQTADNFVLAGKQIIENIGNENLNSLRILAENISLKEAPNILEKTKEITSKAKAKEIFDLVSILVKKSIEPASYDSDSKINKDGVDAAKALIAKNTDITSKYGAEAMFHIAGLATPIIIEDTNMNVGCNFLNNIDRTLGKLLVVVDGDSEFVANMLGFSANHALNSKDITAKYKAFDMLKDIDKIRDRMQGNKDVLKHTYGFCRHVKDADKAVYLLDELPRKAQNWDLTPEEKAEFFRINGEMAEVDLDIALSRFDKVENKIKELNEYSLDPRYINNICNADNKIRSVNSAFADEVYGDVLKIISDGLVPERSKDDERVLNSYSLDKLADVVLTARDVVTGDVDDARLSVIQHSYYNEKLFKHNNTENIIKAYDVAQKIGEEISWEFADAFVNQIFCDLNEYMLELYEKGADVASKFKEEPNPYKLITSMPFAHCQIKTPEDRDHAMKVYNKIEETIEINEEIAFDLFWYGLKCDPIEPEHFDETAEMSIYFKNKNPKELKSESVVHEVQNIIYDLNKKDKKISETVQSQVRKLGFENKDLAYDLFEYSPSFIESEGSLEGEIRYSILSDISLIFADIEGSSVEGNHNTLRELNKACKSKDCSMHDVLQYVMECANSQPKAGYKLFNESASIIKKEGMAGFNKIPELMQEIAKDPVGAVVRAYKGDEKFKDSMKILEILSGGE